MFVRGENPIWFFNNLTGSPVDDTYYAFFLTNDLPYVPQAVYHDPNGLIPWSDPIEFQPSGGLPNDLYFNPLQTYRIEIRQGPSQTDQLIYLIENYEVSGGGGESPALDSLITSQNLVTNPQFADVYFSINPSPYTISTAGTYPVGPGWNLILTGSGITTLSQGTLPGVSHTPGNPPYYLKINNSGWDSAVLQTTFDNNGAIFSGGAIGLSFLAEATTNTQNITVQYAPSTSTGGPSNIFSGTIAIGGFNTYYGLLSPVPLSTNTDLDGSGFVDINFNIAPTGIISITNIQLTGQSVPVSPLFVTPTTTTPGSVPLFQEISYERVVDQEFHIYKNSIIIEPKDTILTGWSFSLNPYQFNNTAIMTATAVTQYVADQTILHQELASQIQTGNASTIERYALQVQPVVSATNTRFALIQYIDPATILPYWNFIVSALARVALVSTKSPATSIRLKMRLIWKNDLPPVISNVEPISSWPANSDPIFSAGWTAISPVNDPQYIIPNTPGEPYPSFSFNGFQLPADTSGTQTLGIVIYTMDNMNSTAPVDYLLFDKISLVPNEFAIDCNPQTYDQVLRQCQFYYEKSYDPGTLPGTATSIGARYASNPLVLGTNVRMYKNSFTCDYLVPKRAAPKTANLNIYAVDGTLGAVQMGIWNGTAYPVPVSPPNPVNVSLSGNYSILASGLNSFTYRPANATLVMAINVIPSSEQGEIYYHFTADSRLGV